MSDHASAHKPNDAEQLTKQRHVNDGVATKPKQTYGPPSGPTGDDYVDRGAVCDQRQGPGCFLTGPQRARLIGELQSRILFAKESFLHAADHVRMEKLVESDTTGDQSWIAMLLLDIATAHLSTLIAGSITALKNVAAKNVAEVRIQNEWDQVERDHGLGFALVETLTAVSETTIRNVTKQVFDAAKKGLTKATSSAIAKTRRQERIGYLDGLADSAAAGFQTMSEVLPGVADDTSLLAFTRSFDKRNHTIAQYSEAITAKLERFEASGVTQIGRNPYVRKRATGPRSDEVDRDVRVVWVMFMSGSPKRLAFEHQDLYSASPSERGPSYGDGMKYTQEAERGLSEADGTNWLVPDEFVDLALERHEQVWRMRGRPRDPLLLDSHRPCTSAPQKREVRGVVHVRPELGRRG
jgi:hypothetical protein